MKAATTGTFMACFGCAAHIWRMERAPHPKKWLTQGSGEDYYFDEEEEPEILDDDMEDGEGNEDPDVEIVASGDANAAAAAKDKIHNSVDSEKAKKVPNENRTTTPYMTKYEKARVLGTRALQIRYGTAGEMAHRGQTADSYAVEMLPF